VPHPYLLVGAGIGGLVAATALARRGHRVEVVERTPELAPVGAGIILGANATAILDALDLDVHGAGLPLASLDVLNASGGVLQGMPLATSPGLRGRMLAFHRAELHRVLVEFLPVNVTLRLGTQVVEVQESADSVGVRFSDGRAGEYTLLIGADGLRSETRRRVHGDGPLRYAGETCWRAVVPGLDVGAAGTETWGHGVRMGVIPLSGGRVYTFLVAVAPEGSPGEANGDVLARFSALGGPCAGALRRMAELGTEVHLLQHDLYEVPAPCWGEGRTWLLGDAAHAMTPNQGQGAAMAIEDAAVLALVIGDGLSDPAESHARYVAERDARVRRVQLDSRRLGEVATVQAPALRWARDVLLPLLPTSLAQSQLERLAAPGVAIAGRLREASGGA